MAASHGATLHRLGRVVLPGPGLVPLRLPDGVRVAGRVRHPSGDGVLLALVDEPLALFDLDAPAGAPPDDGGMLVGETDMVGGLAAGGTFEFLAPPRRYLVALGLQDGIGTAVPLDAATATDAVNVSLPTAPSDTLFGTVLTPEGHRAAGILLRFYDERTGVVVQARDRGSGTYVAFLPAGSYRGRAGLVDPHLGLGTQYELGQIEVRGSHRWDIRLEERKTAVAEPAATLPGEPTLAQNYPNPFNPATAIDFWLPRQGHVRLRVYNVLGQPVRTLVSGDRGAGSLRLIWDARDDAGREVGSGMYFYVLEATSLTFTRRMLLLR